MDKKVSIVASLMISVISVTFVTWLLHLSAHAAIVAILVFAVFFNTVIGILHWKNALTGKRHMAKAELQFTFARISKEHKRKPGALRVFEQEGERTQRISGAWHGRHLVVTPGAVNLPDDQFEAFLHQKVAARKVHAYEWLVAATILPAILAAAVRLWFVTLVGTDLTLTQAFLIALVSRLVVVATDKSRDSAKDALLNRQDDRLHKLVGRSYTRYLQVLRQDLLAKATATAPEYGEKLKGRIERLDKKNTSPEA